MVDPRVAALSKTEEIESMAEPVVLQRHWVQQKGIARPLLVDFWNLARLFPQWRAVARVRGP